MSVVDHVDLDLGLDLDLDLAGLSEPSCAGDEHRTRVLKILKWQLQTLKYIIAVATQLHGNLEVIYA